MSTTGERRASATDAAILEIVRRRSQTSRVEISRELGVTPATVTYAVKRLSPRTAGGERSLQRGKRASLLRLNDQARWAIGCTIDADRLSLAAWTHRRAAGPDRGAARGAERSRAVREALHRALSTLRRGRCACGDRHRRRHHDLTADGPALLREITRDLNIPRSARTSRPARRAASERRAARGRTVRDRAWRRGSGCRSCGRAALRPARAAPRPRPRGTTRAGRRASAGATAACISTPRRARGPGHREDRLAEELELRLTPSSLSSDVVPRPRRRPREPRARESSPRRQRPWLRRWAATSALGIRTVVPRARLQAAPVLVGEVMAEHYTARPATWARRPRSRSPRCTLRRQRCWRCRPREPGARLPQREHVAGAAPPRAVSPRREVSPHRVSPHRVVSPCREISPPSAGSRRTRREAQGRCRCRPAGPPGPA